MPANEEDFKETRLFQISAGFDWILEK